VNNGTAACLLIYAIILVAAAFAAYWAYIGGPLDGVFGLRAGARAGGEGLAAEELQEVRPADSALAAAGLDVRRMVSPVMLLQAAAPSASARGRLRSIGLKGAGVARLFPPRASLPSPPQ
jgi:hypothetical protein